MEIKDPLHLKVIETAMTLYDAPIYLIGIRRELHVDTFNDTFILYSHYNDIYWYTDEFTTDPGLSVLKQPINPKGTAILCEGLHRDIWGWGYHKNKYKALVQVNPCTVYRDNNRDAVLNMDTNKIDRGYFGINLHHANNAKRVGNWSAGCQVFRRVDEFEKVLSILSGKYSFLKTFDYYLYRLKL
jgi:hypothetical protein